MERCTDSHLAAKYASSERMALCKESFGRSYAWCRDATAIGGSICDARKYAKDLSKAKEVNHVYTAVRQEVFDGRKEVEQIAVKHGTDAKAAGRAFEVLHKTSFNADSLSHDSNVRAELAKYGGPADVNITQGRRVVDAAQMKCSDSPAYLKTLQNPKYEGMQKIAPSAHQPGDVGQHSHSLKHGNIKSGSFTTADAKAAIKNPESAFKDIELSNEKQLKSAKAIAKASTPSAGQAALIGGVTSAASSLALGCYQHGEINEAVVWKAGEEGVVGAVVSGASSAATEHIIKSSGDALLGSAGGGAVSGVLYTGYNMAQCARRFEEGKGERQRCMAEEGLKGTVSTTAAVTGTIVCSSFMGPWGFLCGSAASMATRALFQ